MIEPTTLAGYLADLEKWGYELECDDDEYSVVSKSGAITRLENTSDLAAAFEAWHLLKP
jgi:hypothetical protein